MDLATDGTLARDFRSASADRAAVERIVRDSGTSFYWGMRLLPEDRRAAMFAVYAFCRIVDDIADDPAPLGEKKERLAAWRARIDSLYAGDRSTDILRELAEAVERYDLRKSDFGAIIDGMEMDAADRLRIADEAELAVYCDRVACAVGRLSIRVFGLPPETGDPLAAALGEALQLTNILRDLKEDADRDRLYLPAETLIGRGMSAEGAAREILNQAGIPDLCRDLAARAQQRFAVAAALIGRCDRRKVRPARIMMEVYRRLFARLERRGWSQWYEPVRVPTPEKLWVALRHGVF